MYIVICTLSSAHWQQARLQRFQSCGRFELISLGKIEINAPQKYSNYYHCYLSRSDMTSRLPWRKISSIKNIYIYLTSLSPLIHFRAWVILRPTSCFYLQNPLRYNRNRARACVRASPWLCKRLYHGLSSLYYCMYFLSIHCSQ